MAWAPDYVTADELRDFMRTTSDPFLATAAAAASRAINIETCRQFGKVDAGEARVYTARWSARRCQWVVIIDDLHDPAGLDVQAEAGAITGYRLWPFNAAADGKPYERLIVDRESPVQPKGLDGELTITTDKWGWAAVPVPVREATFLQGSRIASRRTSPYGIAGSPDQGSELRLLAKVDVDVAVSLKDYGRCGVIG